MIVDAVGVTKSLKTASRPLITKPSVPLKDLAMGVMMGARDEEQTIDHESLDKVLRAEWEGDAQENAEAMVQDFRSYLEAHRDEIEALTIFYGQPHRRRQLTCVRSV